MSTRRTRRSAAQWTELVREFDATEETQSEFCERKNLGVSTFRKWRQRQASIQSSGPASHGAGFVDVTPHRAITSVITVHIGSELRIN